MIYEPQARPSLYPAQIGVRLSRETLAALRALAMSRGLTVNDLTREIIAAALESAGGIRTTSTMKRREVPRG